MNGCRGRQIHNHRYVSRMCTKECTVTPDKYDRSTGLAIIPARRLAQPFHHDNDRLGRKNFGSFCVALGGEVFQLRRLP